MNLFLDSLPNVPRAARNSPRRLTLEALEVRTVMSGFEVWTIDQSNTRDVDNNGTLDAGGTLYIYQGPDLMGQNAAKAAPEVIDLGSDTYHNYLFGATSEAGVRPHMLLFNASGSHAILSYVASGHIVFIDTATRLPVGVVDVDPQAHAAFPAPDDSYIIVANQNGKLLHRIFTDYENNVFALDPVALDLAPLEGPGRPSNRPICPIVTADSRFTFVTLAGGGMFVVYTEASAPMTIVADYTNDVVHNEGCGGVELNGKMYINAGSPGHHDLYAFQLSGFGAVPNPSNSPAPTLIYSQDGPPATTSVDAHGVTLTRHGRYLWVGDRWANKIVVVDTQTDLVVNEIALAGEVSDDPAPDLLAISPDGNRVFAALRGPIPLTANNPTFNNAKGSTPGVGVIRVTENGRNGQLMAVAPISHLVAGVERADPHAIAVLKLPPDLHQHADQLPDNSIPQRPGGGTSGWTIWLFDSAAGRDRLVDTTRWDNSEFTMPGNQGEANRLDLLTVLAEEIGHLLDPGQAVDGVMIEILASEPRLRPGSSEVDDRSAILGLQVSEHLSICR